MSKSNISSSGDLSRAHLTIIYLAENALNLLGHILMDLTTLLLIPFTRLPLFLKSWTAVLAMLTQSGAVSPLS
jgi:hypothetical protein